MTPGDDGLDDACLAHVPLSIDLPPWVLPILLSAEQRDGALNLRDLAPEWERQLNLIVDDDHTGYQGGT